MKCKSRPDKMITQLFLNKLGKNDLFQPIDLTSSPVRKNSPHKHLHGVKKILSKKSLWQLNCKIEATLLGFLLGIWDSLTLFERMQNYYHTSCRVRQMGSFGLNITLVRQASQVIESVQLLNWHFNVMSLKQVGASVNLDFTYALRIFPCSLSSSVECFTMCWAVSNA